MTQTTDGLSYDGLNRLTQAVTSNPSLPLNVTKTVTYNAIGNITAKSDVGTYTYDPARVHAVASIAPSGSGTVTTSYSYDANGNMLEGRGRTVTWTSFDMVNQITQGTNSVSFTYDSDRSRLKQLSSDGSTKYYLNDPISGAMAEKIVGASQSVTWNNYIMLGGEMVALKVTGATTQTRYFHKDHLGSIVALTDESGAVVERDSFDAWGQRRTPAGQDDPLYPGQSLTSQITRGYTGHEQLDSVGLVHMNGRIYEPVIGKMMSADPTVPDLYDGQAYNRYAYVLNNPLSLTDPTGFRPDLEQRDKNGQQTRGGNGTDPIGGDRGDANDGSGSDAGDSSSTSGTPSKGFASGFFGLFARPNIQIMPKAPRVPQMTRPAPTPQPLPGMGGRPFPTNPSDLLKQGYREIPTKAPNRRTFEDPTTGDRIHHDKGVPGAKGWRGQDHYHRDNPNATNKGDAMLDKNGNPVPKGSGPSHLKGEIPGTQQENGPTPEMEKEMRRQEIERMLNEMMGVEYNDTI